MTDNSWLLTTASNVFCVFTFWIHSQLNSWPGYLTISCCVVYPSHCHLTSPVTDYPLSHLPLFLPYSKFRWPTQLKSNTVIATLNWRHMLISLGGWITYLSTACQPACCACLALPREKEWCPSPFPTPRVSEARILLKPKESTEAQTRILQCFCSLLAIFMFFIPASSLLPLPSTSEPKLVWAIYLILSSPQDYGILDTETWKMF